MKTKIKISGLDCANCALELEEEISKVTGVISVTVNFVNQLVLLEYQNEETLNKVKDVCNHFEEVKVIEEESKHSFKIVGLDCANCALELEEEISKVNGVKEASVDFVNGKVTVSCSEENLNKVKDVCNHFEEVKVVEECACKIDAKIEKHSFKITGLDCANCALELEEEISKVNGVQEASVDFVNGKVTVSCSEETLSKVKDVCNHFEEVKVVEESKKSLKSRLTKENKISLVLIIISFVTFVIALVLDKAVNLGNQTSNDIKNWVVLALYLISYFVVGYPILLKTIKNISKGKIFDENFLMTIASIGAMIINERIEGVAVMLLYQIGELLQSIAVNSSRKEIVSMMDLKSETATIIKNEEQIIIDPKELKIGDIILIKNGEKVPADARIIDGNTSFDTKSLTGEALPKECHEQEEILSGYINIGSVVKAEVLRTYENSTVSKILDLVENSTSKKANPEKFITKFSRIYTPCVCILALVFALVVPLIIALVTGDFSWESNFSSWVYKSLTLLVISCPCALIISIPLTYFNGIGACAKRGVLVKGATYLDTASKVTIACYDKTGTLTEGSFKIKEVHSEDKEKVLSIAAALEKNSNHPIGKAFSEIDSDLAFSDIEEIAGYGLKGYLNNKKYLVGNHKLLKQENIAVEKVDSIATVIYVAEDKNLLGYIEIDDVIKSDTISALKAMKEMGVKKQVMLTGDNQKRAEYVAKELSLDEVYGELLPDQKLQEVERLKKDGTLLYVGDGINDAPVMVASDLAISMGKLGSDAAVEASDIVLVSDRLQEVPNTIKLAKKTRKIVIENIVFSIVMKVLFMVLGLVGLPLIVAVFADVGVMLIAIINSLRMRISLEKTK